MHAGWLTFEAAPKDPSPIHRGAFVARHVICAPLGSPPPGAAGAMPDKSPQPTNRLRVEDTTKGCGDGCHGGKGGVINPLGFSFEGFDSIGQLRTMDGDASRRHVGRGLRHREVLRRRRALRRRRHEPARARLLCGALVVVSQWLLAGRRDAAVALAGRGEVAQERLRARHRRRARPDRRLPHGLQVTGVAMAFSRRKFLLGLGGAVVGLPFFEGLVAEERSRRGRGPAAVRALLPARQRRAAGRLRSQQLRAVGLVHAHAAAGARALVADGQRRRRPIPPGPLATFGPISALNEIEAYVAKTTIVRGLRHPYGTENGHPEGAAQGLTGAGVLYPADQPNFQNAHVARRVARQPHREAAHAGAPRVALHGRHDPEGGRRVVDQAGRVDLPALRGREPRSTSTTRSSCPTRRPTRRGSFS